MKNMLRHRGFLIYGGLLLLGGLWLHSRAWTATGRDGRSMRVVAPLGARPHGLIHHK